MAHAPEMRVVLRADKSGTFDSPQSFVAGLTWVFVAQWKKSSFLATKQHKKPPFPCKVCGFMSLV